MTPPQSDAIFELVGQVPKRPRETVAASTSVVECLIRTDRDLWDSESTHFQEPGARSGPIPTPRCRKLPPKQLKLNTRESDLKRQVKDAETELDTKANDHYTKLNVEQIKTLVIEDKWLAVLEADTHGEMDRISQQLTTRVKELAERYDRPLPQIATHISELEAKVLGHLERMGFAWQ